MYRPPLLYDGESERAASARSALGAPSQYAGGHKRSVQNEHRRPLTVGRRLLGCANRRLLELYVTPAQPQPSRVGAGRGRAIPLGDIRGVAKASLACSTSLLVLV